VSAQHYYNYEAADYTPRAFSWPCKAHLVYDNEVLPVSSNDSEPVVVMRPDPDHKGHWIVRRKDGTHRSIPLRYIHLPTPPMPALAFGLFEGL
jgi:hypothetical protein